MKAEVHAWCMVTPGRPARQALIVEGASARASQAGWGSVQARAVLTALDLPYYKFGPSTEWLAPYGALPGALPACRLAKAGKEAGARLAILTAGATRADPLLELEGGRDLKFEALAGASLARLAAHSSLLVPPGRG